MVSGVGPKSALESVGVDVIADRPGVGQNLWVSEVTKLLTWRGQRSYVF